MSSIGQEFDRWCEEHEISMTGTATAEAFAQFLADRTGLPIIGGPKGEAPAVVAVPGE